MKTAEHPATKPHVTDKQRVATTQYSLRLPVPVAARLAALCEMQPGKTCEQIVAELLTAAMTELERTLPKSKGPVIDYHPDTRQPIYLLTGPFAEFRGLANKHHIQLERELGIEEPEPPYPVDEYMLGEDS
ncbi:MAG: hypothetical protein OEM00_03550 [Burkholderiaceae bacterium]|nr:hypothetical protein [Burkholderiaceae bacterium]